MAYEGRQVNIHVGLQVMRPDLERGKRGREEDIVALIGLVADFDHGSGEEGVAKMIADKLVPSYVIKIIAGQCASGLDLRHAGHVKGCSETARRAVQEATPLSDDCAKDITHVFRVPGTLNFPNISKIKAGRSPIPAPVRITKAWGGLTYSADALRECLSEQPSAPPTQPNMPEQLKPAQEKREPRNFHERVDALARQNLPQWVLPLFGGKARPYADGYQIASRDLGRNLEEDLAISPDVICDFGLRDIGDPRKGMRSPIDVVMAFGDTADPTPNRTERDVAALWLCKQLGQHPARLQAPIRLLNLFKGASPEYEHTGDAPKIKGARRRREAKPRPRRSRQSRQPRLNGSTQRRFRRVSFCTAST